jgi:predicted DNA-binding transcriptional regulator AlpA
MFQPQSASEPRRTAPQLSDETLITGKHLRQLLGHCSEMHIWRLLNKQGLQPLAFPKPIKINSRNYWRLGAIRQWIEDQEAKSRQGALPRAAAPAGRTKRGVPKRSAR